MRNTETEAMLKALQGIVALANDPAGSTLTLREVFGTFQHGVGLPQIEGKAILDAIRECGE